MREAAARYVAGGAREVALRILEARFGEGKRRWQEGDAVAAGPADRNAPVGTTRVVESPVFELADFQEAAVRRASRILDSRRGAVIADSIGLGKTYVALALIERALREGRRVAVFTPAALRREWTRALGRLRSRYRVSDAYGVPEAPGAAVLERSGAHAVGVDGVGPAHSDRSVAARGVSTGPEHRYDARALAAGPLHAPHRSSFLAWVSHERLSRGTYPRARLEGFDLVVVDEAHAFRSPRTRRYRALAELCRGARVLLLTATPVNNSVWDLYFQLRLFAGDGDFRDVGVPDLKEAIRAAAEPASPAPPTLLPVLHEVMIRRTRPFLREHYGAIRTPGATSAVGFPRRAAPVPVLYTLDGVPPGVDAIVETIEALTFAAFRPERYSGRDASVDAGEAGDPGGVADLMRAGLLKRFESSLAAFRATMRRQLRYLDAFLAALDRGRLLRPRDHRALYTAGGDGDLTQLVLEEVALVPLPRGIDADLLRRDVASDRDRLAELLDQAGADDPKLDRLIALLDRGLRGEKVLLFTEYRDTARYLWRALARRGGVALIDGSGAFLGTSPAGRRAVIERFAPRANHVRPPPARERVDLLIATDVLAEGLNLQDAAHVVSYDLPWNPVRLIQRIGRVDRLGSPHETVHPYHFLPDRGIDRALRLLDRLRAKLTAIGRTVGADGAVLSGEDVGYRALVDRLAAGDPDALDAIERADGAALEVLEGLRVAWEKATARAHAAGPHPRPSDPAVPGLRAPRPDPEHAAGPVAACIAVDAVRPRRVLVAYRIGPRAAWWVVEADQRGRLSLAGDHDAAAAEILLAALEAGDAAHRSPTLAPDRRLISRTLAAVRPKVAERVAILGAAPCLPAASAGADAARRILAALAAIPGGPEPRLCARADALLAALARPLDAGAETTLRHALDGIHPTRDARRAAESLLDAVEAAIAHTGNGVAPRWQSPWATTPPTVAVELIGILEARPVESAARG